MAVTTVSVLGATGSIGTSTLDVLRRNPDAFRVVALTGHRNVKLLEAQCREFAPEVAVVADAERAADLRLRLADAGLGTEVHHGDQGLEAAAGVDAEITVAAIVGAAGLRPTLKAVARGRRILLANKESLVMGGALFMAAVERSGAELLPVDSEHNAIFQCLPGNFCRGRLVDSGVSRVVLTASGGPFRDWAVDALQGVTPEQACAHPNWSMGRKISVDSATLMNKGLEVIEASWLFGLGPAQLDVVIHPQSIVHSFVEYADGSMLAQLGNPDMRTPIAHALAWPRRIPAGVPPLDLVRLGQLEFRAPDTSRFRCLDFAFRALREGGASGAVLNAANEAAVEAFLERRLPFTRIPDVIATALDEFAGTDATDLDALLALDREVRDRARAMIGDCAGGMQ